MKPIRKIWILWRKLPNSSTWHVYKVSEQSAPNSLTFWPLMTSLIIISVKTILICTELINTNILRPSLVNLMQ